MAREMMNARSTGLCVASIVFGILGLVFYFWRPLGVVLSLAGLVLGLIGSIRPGIRSRLHATSTIGFIVSAIALAIDVFVAVNGLQTIDMIPYR
jgi:hypothetical protein